MTIKFDLISYILDSLNQGSYEKFGDFEKSSKHDGIEVEQYRNSECKQ